MGREVLTREIGNHKYRTTQLGALQGRKVLARLESVAGGVIPEELSEYLYDTFSGVSKVSGGIYGDKWPDLKSVFDNHFCGNYGEMGQWLKFCIEVNFANFTGTPEPESP